MHPIPLAVGFLERATELRAVASEIRDAHNKVLLIGAAEQYEQVADRLLSWTESVNPTK